jgi:selenide,water dikinase
VLALRAGEETILRDIVLVGGGHSHVGVLRQFGRRPLPGVRLTVICTDTHTPYSGMLPGYIAGHYSYDQVHIDLRRLAVFAGARFFRDEVIGLDRERRRVLCRDRPPLAYDLLSINIGSTPRLDGVAGAAEKVLPIKPIRCFNEGWLALLQRVCGHPGGTTIAVVGAGAGGVELTLAMQYRLRRELQALGRDPDELRLHLFSANREILSTHNARVRRTFERVLAERGVVVHRLAEVSSVSHAQLATRSGERLAADEIIWVTQAGGAGWLRETGLSLDSGGFILVGDTLQTVSDPLVFAAGDCAAMIDVPLEKAGVFAVRQGRPLAENLRRSLLAMSLRRYRPQARWLALISTGDRRAVASRGAVCAEGAWVWRWKDRIDRRFMAGFQDLPPIDEPPTPLAPAISLDASEAAQARASTAIHRGGGAPVAATVVRMLRARNCGEVWSDLEDGRHAAIVQVPPGKAMVQTLASCGAFVDDPWLFARIAANDALDDIFVRGAEAHSASIVATLPAGLDEKVEDTLFQLLSGAAEEFTSADCAVVGARAVWGPELAIGLAVNGLIDAQFTGVMGKGSMRPGEVLILNKPIGSATLLAAHLRLRATGRWIDAALLSMLQSNRLAARCLNAYAASACSRVSTLGLHGQLLAMTRRAGVAVELDLNALPVLDGAAETAALGFPSRWPAAGPCSGCAPRASDAACRHPNHALLFDPETAGGLLASVPPETAEACLQALRALGYPRATSVGRVLPAGQGPEPIQLKL